MHRNALSFCGMIIVEKVNEKKSISFKSFHYILLKFILILLLKEALTVVGCFFHLRKVVVYLSKLTIKQKKFADEYIISGNAYQSAINAGYSDNYAKAQSSKMLENVGIKSYIEERMKELDEESIADQKEVLQYLTRVMRGKETEEVLASVGNFEQEIKNISVGAKDRIKAAELIGKRYSLWTDRVEVDSDLTIVFEDDYGE